MRPDDLDYDDTLATIDRLHEEAEEAAALAKHYTGHKAGRLRALATRLVRQAAALRAQIEED